MQIKYGDVAKKTKMRVTATKSQEAQRRKTARDSRSSRKWETSKQTHIQKSENKSNQHLTILGKKQKKQKKYSLQMFSIWASRQNCKLHSNP